MTSAAVIFFMFGGHTGFCSGNGSVTIRFPPGVVITNVECPYQVMASFCIFMRLLCDRRVRFDNRARACRASPLAQRRRPVADGNERRGCDVVDRLLHEKAPSIAGDVV